jgi:hypothetical protein
MPLSRDTLNEIIDLLLPLLTHPAARIALLDRALGLDGRSTALHSRIRGAHQQFCCGSCTALT